MIGKNVLIVEDEFMIAEMLSAMIEDLGMTVCGRAATADMAVTLAHQNQPDLILMDVRLKGVRDGVDAAMDIVAVRHVPIVYITGSGDPDTVARINTDHPAGILFKPFQFDALKDLVGNVLG